MTCARALSVGLAIFTILAAGCEQVDPELGWLSVETVDTLGVVVSGASVRVDGADRGDTPALIEVYPATYSVSVFKPGFESLPEDTTVTVPDHKTTRVVFALVASADSGWVSVAAVDAARDPIEGAPVLIDGVLRGRTPLMIRLPEEIYTVSVDSVGFVSDPEDSTVLVRGDETTELVFELTRGFHQTVLVEDFSNIRCGPCVDAEEMLLRVTGEYPLSCVITAHVQTTIPYSFDPMYYANPDELLARRVFYGLTANPALIINGTKSFTSEPSSDEVLRDSLEAHFKEVLPVGLELSRRVEDNTVKVDVTVRSITDLAGDFHLIVLSIQTVIEYEPGSINTVFDPPRFVRRVRDFIPGEDTIEGQIITITEGMKQDFHFEAPLRMNFDNPVAEPEDDPNKVECIAILQEWNSKRIIQAVSTLE